MSAADGNWAGWNKGRIGGEHYRGKLLVPEHSPPLVRRLFEEMNAQHATLTEVANRAGLRRRTVTGWRETRVPNVEHLRACFNVLGLDLVVAEKEER